MCMMLFLISLSRDEHLLGFFRSNLRPCNWDDKWVKGMGKKIEEYLQLKEVESRLKEVESGVKESGISFDGTYSIRSHASPAFSLSGYTTSERQFHQSLQIVQQT